MGRSNYRKAVVQNEPFLQSPYKKTNEQMHAGKYKVQAGIKPRTPTVTANNIMTELKRILLNAAATLLYLNRDEEHHHFIDDKFE